MPAFIKTVANRAIELREESSRYYRDKPELAESNKGHTYFIETLQMALDLLEPCITMTPPDVASQISPMLEAANPESSPNPSDSTTSDDSPKMNAREIAEEFHELTMDETPKLYEMQIEEENRHEELLNKAQAFIDDLKDLQKKICDIWHDFETGTSDPIVPTMLTMAILKLAVAEEDKLRTELPCRDGVRDYYASVVADLLRDEAIAGVFGSHTCCDTMSNGTEPDDFCFLPVFFMRWKLRRDHDGLQKPFLSSVPCLSLDENRQKAIDNCDIFLTSWITELRLLDFDLSNKQVDFKLDKAVRAKRIAALKMFDPISTTLLQICNGAEISISAVFMASCLFQMQKQLANRSAGAYQKLISFH